MIKINRVETEQTRCAEEELRLAKEDGTTYNTKNVNIALREVFHSKCYICENKSSTSYQIEHLVPHRENAYLKYSWDNLFFACAHCNGIKSDKYNPIIDCTKVDVEKKIAFRKEGYFGADERFIFKALDNDIETKNTVELLEAVYYASSTVQKEFESRLLRKHLREDLSRFKNYIREYEELDTKEEKEDMECLIRNELKDSSEFTAFKRWLIRDNAKFYNDLDGFLDEGQNNA